MRSIAGLFGRSPFKLLEQHMEKVKECMKEIPPIFDALYAGDYEKVRSVSQTILKLEHEADNIKDSIRSQMPASLFMPVDRRDFLSLLSAQDDISDAAEDISIVLRFKEIEIPTTLKPLLMELVNSVMAIGDTAYKLIQELDNLVEVSFGGPEADTVLGAIDGLGTMEWEADKLQFKITKEIFALEEELSKGEFFILLEIVRKLGSLADKSEKVGKLLRMFITG